MIRKTFLLICAAWTAAAMNLTACNSTSQAETVDKAALEAQRLEMLRQQEMQQNVWESRLAAENRFSMNITPTKEEQRIARKHASSVVGNLSRNKFFIHYLLTRLQENDMPIELAAVPLVESGLNPQVGSNGGAHGPWQYKRATGRSVGLQTSKGFDEIYDFVESTDASVRYLQKLYRDLGAWDLAVAAYNQGEYGVKRAVDAAKARGVSEINSQTVTLSKGARNYLQRFRAYADILRNPQNYGVKLPEVKNRPAFRKVEIAGRVNSMRKAAELSGADLSTLKILNNGYRSDHLSTADEHGLYVPVEHASRLEHVLQAYGNQSYDTNAEVSAEN